MAREDVNIKVSANVAEAIQMWKAMEAGPEGMAKALDGMGQKGSKSTKSMGDELVSMVGKWASVGAAVAAVTSAINAQWEAVKRLRQEKIGNTNDVDEVWTQFQVQSGLKNGPESDRVRAQLFQTIANRRTAPLPGLESAVALGSAGASVQDITGGGLDEFLKLITASNAVGRGSGNQAELAKSMVMFLKANGLQPNREGMAGTSLAIQQLFGGTNLQLSNLNRFAPEAGKIAKMSGMAPEDQLAQYSMFLDTMEESMGAVAMRSGIVRLATAGSTPEQVKALKGIGLKPEDVDFQGEDWAEVYSRLQKGFSGVPAERANISAKKLFGDEGLPFYTTLLAPGSLEEARKRGAMARDPTGAADRLGTAENSLAAGARQAETLAAYGLYDKGTKDPAIVRKRLDALLKNWGADEATMAAIRKEAEDPLGYDAWYDMSAEGQAARAASMMTSGDPRFSFGGTSDRFPGLPGGQRSGPAVRGYLSEQMLGTRPIKILGPDGLDIDHSEGSPVHDLSQP